MGRKLLQVFSWIFMIAACVILLDYNFSCCEHILFFKILWTALLLVIMAIGWVAAQAVWIKEPDTGWPYKWAHMPEAAAQPLVEPANYTVSKKKFQQLESNPVVQKVAVSARSLDAAAILCEPAGIKIYSSRTISPTHRRVFAASDVYDDSNVTHSGEERKKEEYQREFDNWFYVQGKPDQAISFYAEKFPLMEKNDQQNFSAVIAQILGDGYIVLEHTGRLSWDTTKEVFVAGETSYYSAPSGGFITSNSSGTVLKGNSGSIQGFYASIVKKELAAACAADMAREKRQKTLQERQLAADELSRQTNKW